MNAPDPKALRAAFGQFMTGVTVVTALSDDGTPVGFTANSFSSVSLDPPLLLVCPGKFLSSYDVFRNCTHFAVSILAEGQEEVSNIFARSGADRFGQVSHQTDLNGVPVIDGAIATFSCSTHQTLEMGDHCVLIGEVEAFESNAGRGLGYVGGKYFSLGLERAALETPEATSVCGAIVEMSGKVLLETVSGGFRPVQATYDVMGALLPNLRASLASHGVSAKLGQTYSVFDDAATGVHSTYFLATADTIPDGATVTAVPIAELTSQTFATPAIARMMARFAAEAQTRSFALYLGDAEQGDVHSLP